MTIVILSSLRMQRQLAYLTFLNLYSSLYLIIFGSSMGDILCYIFLFHFLRGLLFLRRLSLALPTPGRVTYGLLRLRLLPWTRSIEIGNLMPTFEIETQ